MKARHPEKKEAKMSYPFKRSIGIRESEDPSGKTYVTMMREMLHKVQAMDENASAEAHDAIDHRKEGGASLASKEDA